MSVVGDRDLSAHIIGASSLELLFRQTLAWSGQGQDQQAPPPSLVRGDPAEYLKPVRSLRALTFISGCSMSLELPVPKGLCRSSDWE